MHAFLDFLRRRTPNVWARYGLVLIMLGLVTLFRMVVPLDSAPFLLYLPIVFIIGVALGQGPGFVGIVLSAIAAASFFLRADQSWFDLTTRQTVAIVEYFLVAGAMMRVCGAIRALLVENELGLAELRESETKLRTIVDTVPVGIMLAEAPTGRIIGRNGRLDDIVGAANTTTKSIAQYGEWTAFDAEGRRIDPDTYPLARVIRGATDEASMPIHYERRDGSRIWLDLTAASVKDADGKVTGAVLAVADVDARTKAEETTRRLLIELKERKEEAEAAREAAESANRAKSAFLANMSHELRTPLSAVIGYTELLEEEAADLAETFVLSDLGKIKSNAKHLLGLINDVLDLSKVEANKMDLFIETVAVDVFVRDAAATVQSLVDAKHNTLTLDLADGLGDMRSDAVKLRQTLFNLLGNACKFTTNGRIGLRVTREPGPDGDWLVFAVSDTGIGMTADQCRKLFTRFSQGDESTTRRFGGTGLGLALSRAFATLLGGDVSVASVMGEGSCFTLRVPAEAPDLSLVATAADTDSLEDRGGGDLVLVIDDEASHRDLVSRFLHRQKFSVRTAASGRTGLDLARSLKPRVILLDVMMPEMDGWSVLRALKADPATTDIPVVMVSFVADPGLVTAMGAAGAVTKPIDWVRFKRVLEPFREAAGDVLVVDDDVDMRARLRAYLERTGWTVREAGDGAEALDRVAEATPRMVLLDLTMPVMDGFAFLHRLRATPGCKQIPVVVLSARDITADDRARLAEADRVLKKGETSLRALAAELRGLEAGAP